MSGLGDLLRAHLEPENEAIQEEIQQTDAEQHVPSATTAPAIVFPERVEKKLVDEECQSNASSTDDYVRELLDPNDRPRNVWHVVEGPKASESAGEDGTQASGDGASSQHQSVDMVEGAPVTPDMDNFIPAETNNDHTQYSTVSNQDDEHPSRELDESELSHEKKTHLDADSGKEHRSSRHRHDRDLDKDATSRDKDHHRVRNHDKDRHRDRDDRHKDRERRDSRDRDSRSHRSGSRHKSSRRTIDDRSDSESRRKSDYSRHRSDRDRNSRRRNSRSRSKGSSSRRSRERSRSNSQSPITKRNSRTILIMQLNPKVTSRDLEDLFRDIGPVREVRLVMETKTRRHKGIAYIEFEDAESAQKAFTLNGQTFFDAPIVIQSALTGDRPNRSSNDNWHLSSSTSKTTRSSSSSHQHHSHHHSGSRSHHSSNSYRVYVGGLHVNITEEMLKSLFEPFGPILRLELMRDRITNASRGYAFISYADIEDGQSAVLALDGLELGGKPIKVSKSTDKNERQSSTVTDFSSRSGRGATAAGHYDDEAESQTGKSRDVTSSLFELAGH